MANKKEVDEHPQFFNMKVTQGSTDAFAMAGFVTPCQYNLDNGDARVMEISKIFIKLMDPDVRDGIITYVHAQVVKKALTAMLEFNDPDLVIEFEKQTEVLDTAATDTTLNINRADKPVEFDFTGPNGAGMIFANKTMHLQIDSNNQSGAKTAWVKVLYRLKRVNATELLGYIQE